MPVTEIELGANRLLIIEVRSAGIVRVALGDFD
jgi:hypothetical protein